jgi:hypothetical protein
MVLGKDSKIGDGKCTSKKIASEEQPATKERKMPYKNKPQRRRYPQQVAVKN